MGAKAGVEYDTSFCRAGELKGECNRMAGRGWSLVSVSWPDPGRDRAALVFSRPRGRPEAESPARTAAAHDAAVIADLMRGGSGEGCPRCRSTAARRTLAHGSRIADTCEACGHLYGIREGGPA